MNSSENFIETLKKLFPFYKSLGEKSMSQVDEASLFWRPNETSNSMGILVQHLSGNMLSRFTDFYTSDGEKQWRNRDAEFEPFLKTKAEVISAWDKGWDCLMSVVNNLKEDDLTKIVFIRNEGHTVLEALLRQLAHYSYHVGQLIFIAKSIADNQWQTLSIAKGKSDDFNIDKFEKDVENKFFTEGS